MATRTLRKSYRLTTKDKPLHEELKRRFYAGDIAAWSVVGHEEWWLEETVGTWRTLTFADMADYLGMSSTTSAKRSSVARPALVAMLQKLAHACPDTDLAEEARELLAAA